MHEETIRALTAPPESSLEAPGSTEPPEPTMASAPWYRRWRAWLAAGLVVAVVGSASCQASASVKHAGLCTTSRATMNFMASLTASGSIVDSDTWSAARDMVGVAERVC
jgi:hypothetical protein